MWSFFSEVRARQLSFFWSALLIVGLFTTTWVKAIPSIGVAGLFLTGIGYAVRQRSIAQRAHWPALLSFTLVYLLHAAWGVGQASAYPRALVTDLVLELPFVLLPAAFLLLPTWLPIHKSALWLLLLGCCLVSASASVVNFLANHQDIIRLYAQSRVMPTWPDYIRFSLLVSMASAAGAVLLVSRGLPRALRWATGVGIVLLFLFQHLLAVRSGLVTLYAAGLGWLGWLGYARQRWRAALAGLLLIGALGVGSLRLFPTLQNRIADTRFDTEQVSSAQAANNFSVTGRVYSYEVAWALIRRHPLLGVSKIGMEAEIASQYSYRYPEITKDHYLLPHNQFLYNLLAYGAVGLLLFLIGYYYPLWVALRTGNVLVALLYLILTLSFLVEYTLETQIGVLVGLFFLLLAAAPEPPGQTSVPHRGVGAR